MQRLTPRRPQLTQRQLAPTLLAMSIVCAIGTPFSVLANANAVNPEQGQLSTWPEQAPAFAVDQALEQRIDGLLKAMTLKQKIAQMVQPEIRDITVEDMREYGFGSYLNGGGAFPNDNKHASAADWIALAEKLYQASIDASKDGSTIPTMWGTDAVHGHNNVIGATLFPHNIGLGAMNNPALIEKIAAATAAEVKATGIDWVFAPTVAVVRDDRWGRTYEGYSEDPAIVRDYSAAIVQGLQGKPGSKGFLAEDKVIATVKHFLGDGGTEQGVDQGNNIASEADLVKLHAQGYYSGIGAGAQTVMASFNSWHGVKNHGNRYLLTDVLKSRMHFDGLVVGDWNGHGQIPGCSNDNCVKSAQAGLDVYMVPTPAWKGLFNNLMAQAQSGELPMTRVDDAVRRILRVKIRAGLLDGNSPAKRALSGKTALIGHPDHRAVAAQAVRESLVLLKNTHGLLPLSPKARIGFAGSGADNIGQQSGGWTISWQGTGNNNSDFPGGSSIYQGFAKQIQAAGGKAELAVDGKFSQKPDVAVVVFGEEPYAEGNGDIANVEFQRGNKTDLALLKSLKAQGIKVVSVFLTGRPLWINPELNQSDAFVVAWLPGSEGRAVADVLLKDSRGKVQHDFKGKLSFSWPASPTQQVNKDDGQTPLLPYGYGLTYRDTRSPLDNTLSETKADDSQLANLPLFDRAPKAPWGFGLLNQTDKGMDWAAVVSSVQTLGNISIRSIDRRVQEDARRIVWQGEGEASVFLGSAFPRDLRAYPEAQGVLQVDIRTLKGEGELWLGMGCGENCQAMLPLQAHLAATSDWQTITVDLACFAKQPGFDFGKVQHSFRLTSRTARELDIGDIQLKPNGAKQATIQCDKP